MARTFRNRASIGVIAGSAAAGLAACIGGIVDDESTAAVAFWTVWAGVFVAIAARALRMGIEASDSGLTVRGLVRTRRAGWSDVSRFTLVKENTLYDSVAVAAVLHDGTKLWTSGLNARSATSAFADRMLRSLESYRPAGVGTQRTRPAQRIGSRGARAVPDAGPT